jgi:hypothetical protein
MVSVTKAGHCICIQAIMGASIANTILKWEGKDLDDVAASAT